MKVAIVIPAYNEEETLGGVVSACRQAPEVSEVIVVSDGSTDRTVEVAHGAGATRVVELKENQGKGAAMKVGVDHTNADVVLFVDGDLMGLTPRHVLDLVRPVLEGTADMTLGLFDGGRFSSDFAQVVAPFLSGQRAMRRSLLDQVEDMQDARYGVEVILTDTARRLGARVVEVPLEQLTHRHKEEKAGLAKGFALRMKMYWEIMKSVQKLQRR